jgi:hypothetical protein
LAGLAKSRPRGQSFPTAAVAVGCAFGAGLVAAILADSVVAIGVSAAGIVTTVVTHFVTRGRRQPLEITDPPEVRFSTTGVLFGEHARRWRGYKYRLNEVRVRFGELTHLEPAYLELEFSTGWRETTLSIPVPSALERDAVELAAKLEDMMLGRALG